MTELHIKNMVCPRCVMAVEDLLRRQGLTAVLVRLGVAQVQEDLTESQLYDISCQLEQMGFELLADPQTQLVEEIRLAVIEWVRMEGEREKISLFLQHRLAKDYSALSKLYSQVRGMTVERFAILQRVEFAKELLCYRQLSISEIAFRLGYSSPTHLSAQFRQETGLSPKAFKSQVSIPGQLPRKGLDEI